MGLLAPAIQGEITPSTTSSTNNKKSTPGLGTATGTAVIVAASLYCRGSISVALPSKQGKLSNPAIKSITSTD